MLLPWSLIQVIENIRLVSFLGRVKEDEDEEGRKMLKEDVASKLERGSTCSLFSQCLMWVLS